LEPGIELEVAIELEAGAELRAGADPARLELPPWPGRQYPIARKAEGVDSLADNAQRPWIDG
jgi:hypothetical protein